MRAFAACLALLATAVPAYVQAQEPTTVPVEPTGSQADAWRARLDDPSLPITRVSFAPEQDGAHIVAGAAAVFWRPADTASGSFTARATFRQLRAPTHPEGYGLLVGGRDLAGPDQDYLYFLVRDDGRWIIKHRAGAETHDLSGGWRPDGAVRPAGADGQASNTLAIEVGADSVRFLVNGSRVEGLARARGMRTDGVVGLRINHRLDVRVSGFAVRKRIPGS